MISVNKYYTERNNYIVDISINNKRLNYVDLAKSIGIIGIIAIHSLNSTYDSFPKLKNWIAFFMIAIFYVTFGWMKNIKNNKKIDLKQFAKKRLYTLGVPYVCFSVIIICFDIILFIFKYNNAKQILSDIYKTFSLAGIGTLWFLPTLFFAEIFLNFILTKEKNIQYLSIITSLIIIIVGVNILNLSHSESLIYEIIIAPIKMVIKSLFGFLFGISAYLICKWNDIIEKKITLIKRTIISAVLLIIGIGISYYNIAYDFNHLAMKNPIIYFTISFFISISIILFCKNISDIKIHSKILQFYGKQSLVIMLTHYSLLIPCLNIFTNHIFGNELYSKFPYDLCIFGVILLLEIPISLGIQKYCPLIIGKSKCFRINNKSEVVNLNL